MRRHYNNLLNQREVIELNLLKLRELIEINEKIEFAGQEAPMPKDMPAAATPAAQEAITASLQADHGITATHRHENAGKNSNTGMQYDPHANWQKKILYAMNMIGVPATAKEIAAQIKQLEPESRLSVDKSVELTTSRMSKAGEITARKEGVKNYYSIN